MNALEAYLVRVEATLKGLSRRRKAEVLRDLRANLHDAAERSQVQSEADWQRLLDSHEAPEALAAALHRLDGETLNQRLIQHLIPAAALFLGLTGFFTLHSIRCAGANLMGALGCGLFLGSGLTAARQFWVKARLSWRLPLTGLAGLCSGLIWSLFMQGNLTPAFLLMGVFVGLAAELALSRVTPWKTLPVALSLAGTHHLAMTMVAGQATLRASLLVFFLALMLQAFLGISAWVQDLVLTRWALR